MNGDYTQNLLYFCLISGIVLVSLLISFRITISRLKQKNYFLNRDRERYAETLYASKDGYFAFIYPDERIKDPRRTVRERCSRRLAVMLNLKQGTQASFADVLNMFYKDDAAKIKKYLNLMQEEGIPFEDTFYLKNGSRGVSIFSGRINGQDGNLYCDMLWFRDLSAEMLKIEKLEKERSAFSQKLHRLEALIDNLSYPVWLRDDELNIIAANKKYVEYSGFETKNTALTQNFEFNSAREIAQIAQQTNKAQKKNINIINNGQVRYFELAETPFHSSSLEKISTVGTLYDMTELDSVKRNFKIHQTAHLEVLSALGTAFSIFNNQRKMIFYNKSFLNLWNLDSDFLESNPGYAEFLEAVRTRRLLPEVSDFKTYKTEEDKLFSDLIEPKEELLHIPDGRTFRRLVAPHPNGLIFAYEDVSDRLAAARMVNELVSVQQNILDNINDAVIIFGADHRLKYFNRSYQKLWKSDAIKMQDFPNISEVLEMQKPFFSNTENWESLKQNMLAHILNICARFRLERNDNKTIDAIPVILSDESIMITYIAK